MEVGAPLLALALAPHLDSLSRQAPRQGPVTAQELAAITLANGGDNIGVYVPKFAAAGNVATAGYVAVFLFMVDAWCALGRHLASRPLVAKALSRWDHILLPIVLITIGTLILVQGGAFGL